jgi:DNA polymerase-3 subunit delta'
MLFSEVIGQESVKQQLIHSGKEGRVSHALLFFGPKGSGPLPMALAFAQYLNCENPGPTDSCGTCSSCIKSMKMVHPDIHYVYPVVTTKENTKPKSSDFLVDWRSSVLANPYLDINDWIEIIVGEGNKQGFIPAEESNEIVKKINYKAFEAPYKILILWMPEKMRQEAANKLLKSLEEPPEKTIFILVTEHRDQLITTILSRTQLVKVNRLRDEEIAAELIRQKGIDSPNALELARLADGDFHTAKELAEQQIEKGRHDQDFLNWMRLCFNPMKTMPALMAWVEDMAEKNRETQKQFLFSCIRMVRECMLVNMGDPRLVKLDQEQLQTLGKFLPFVNLHNMGQFAGALNEAYFHVERNAHAKILFLDLSLKISKILQIK